MPCVAQTIRLYPNNKQISQLRGGCGLARYAFNWALDLFKQQLAVWQNDNSQPYPTTQWLDVQFNAAKKTTHTWTTNYNKWIHQLSIQQHLDKALKSTKGHLPVYRKRGKHDGFTLWSDAFRIQNNTIRLGKMGWFRLANPFRFTGRLISATVKPVADYWYVSIIVDVPHNTLPPLSCQNQARIGVDLGIANLATFSRDLAPLTGPKPLKHYLEKVRQLNRSLSRKVRGSKHYLRVKTQLTRLHHRISNIRKDTLHKLTHHLVTHYRTIAIEDLDVKRMVQDRRFSRGIHDVGFYEFKRQLLYKSAMTGSTIKLVDRFFPSSKTCSHCQHVLPRLDIKTRRWTCPSCGIEHDRDVNAAINLEQQI